jgi:tetratricopeptide (TPR) repeat protein
MGPSDLEISADLSDALRRVLREAPTEPDPTVVVAACLETLAKGYGLSESQHVAQDPLERAGLPTPAQVLLHHVFAAGEAELEADTLRDRLHDVFAELAQLPDARRQLNSNQPLTETELLTLGQIYWNLEGTPARDRLPIRPGKIVKRTRSGSGQVRADIPVPGANKDFATMTWTARVNEKCSGKSSSQGFRKQGSRLAVLAARLIVGRSDRPLPDLDGAVLRQAPSGRAGSKTLLISWPEEEPVVAAPVVVPRDFAVSGKDGPPMATQTPGEARRARSDTVRVLVGAPAEVGADYQRRACDAEIDELWARGGDRRVWLRGGPGLGKSYTARRVMQESVANTGADRDELLVWVASADADAVIEALSTAADRLRQHGFAVPGDARDSSERKARALLGLLAVSTWRWLIVLDNVDAGSVIEAGLVPPGGNPNGRVLLTTLGQDPRIASNGYVVAAHLFTPEESEAYLRSEVHFAGRASGAFSRAPAAQTRRLAQTVGHHPLALSIAASTITANAMSLPDWIDEFTEAETMDTAADEPDRGGYPHQLSATWQVALAKASQGLPQGVVQRAAIVAALQDPDGHPTWLWERDAVTGWVAGGTRLARRHRVPVVVQRLIDSGLIELHGTWRGGRVAIHQLAARAVREASSAAALAEIAGILLEQWLLELTGSPQAAQPDTLRRNLRPIAALPDLPAPSRRTVTALLAFAQPAEAFADRSMVKRLEPYLPVGGVTLQITLGERLIGIGDEEAALGRTGQARATYQEAADLYRPLVDDDSLDDDELALCLIHLGDLEDQLGNPHQARASRERAIPLLERLADTAPDTDKLIEHLAGLVTLHDDLGNQDDKAQVLHRAEDLLADTADDLTSNAESLSAGLRGGSWGTLAGLMEQAGRLDLAKECRIRELGVYEGALDEPFRWASAVQALALLHAQSGEWTDAERLLGRLTDLQQTPWANSANSIAEFVFLEHPKLLVLLASVQRHLGRHEEAGQTLARSVGQSSDSGAGSDPPEDEPIDEELKRALQELRKSREIRMEGLLLADMAVVSASRGRLEEAVGLSASHIDLAQQIAQDAPGDTNAEARLADAYSTMGGLLFLQQEAWEAAATNFASAAGILQMLAELDPSRPDAQRKLGFTLSAQGLARHAAGDHVAAVGALTRAVSAYQRSTELAPDDQESVKGLADALGLLAEAHRGLGHFDVAVGCYEESISLRRGAADREPDEQEPAKQLADTLDDLGQAYIQDGNHDRATGCYEESISIRIRLAEQSPDDATAQVALAEAWMQLAGILLRQEQWEDAVEPLRRCSDTYADVVRCMGSEDHASRSRLAGARTLLGVALIRAGQWEEGMTHLNEALSAQRTLAEQAPDDRKIQNDLASTLAILAEQYAETGQLEEAADYITRSTNILQLLADLFPGERPNMLIELLQALAETLRDLGRTRDADEALARAHDLEETYSEGEGREGQ